MRLDRGVPDRALHHAARLSRSAALAVALVTVSAQPARADEPSSPWEELPNIRMMIGLNAERATATSSEGTNYDLTSGGFGADVAYYLRFGLFQPFLSVGIDANLASRDKPCRNDPFNPDILLCEDTGSPLRVLGFVRAGARLVFLEGKLGLTAGAQYLVQGIYVTDSGGFDDEVLPYGQVDWAGGNFVVSAGAGLGGYFMVDYTRNVDVSIFNAVSLRLERLDWDRTESVVRGVNLHVMLGMLTFQ